MKMFKTLTKSQNFQRYFPRKEKKVWLRQDLGRRQNKRCRCLIRRNRLFNYSHRKLLNRINWKKKILIKTLKILGIVKFLRKTKVTVKGKNFMTKIIQKKVKIKTWKVCKTKLFNLRNQNLFIQFLLKWVLLKKLVFKIIKKWSIISNYKYKVNQIIPTVRLL